MGPGGVEPRKAYQSDAGYDLFVSIDIVVPAQQTMQIHTYVAVELPPGVWAMLVPRSSTLGNRGLHVMTGILDNGYRGELSIMVFNLNAFPVVVQAGERIAQIIPMPLLRMELVQVDALAESDRGNGGYGSSGR